jgi:hypothetical protein
MIWTMIITLTAVAFFLGWRERNGLTRSKWLLLLGLRLGAVVILCLVLLNIYPGLFRGLKRQNLLILADASQSMSLNDGQTQSRWQRALGLASRQHLPGRKISVYRTASEGLKDGLPDSLIKPLEYTDLSEALKLAARSKPGAILLLSDGNHNQPADPLQAAATGIPVYAIGFGPAGGLKKALILDIWSEGEIETGQQSEISITLNGVPAGNRASLWENDVRLAEKTIASGGDTALTFKITPQPEGLHRYTAVLESPGKQILDRASVTVSAVKKSFKLTFIFPRPDWNLRFLLQAAGRNPAYAADIMLRQGPGWRTIRPSGKNDPGTFDSLGNYDAIVLGSTEPGDIPSLGEQKIADLVRQKGRGLFLVGSFRPAGNIGKLAPIFYDQETKPSAGTVLPAQQLVLSAMLEAGREEQIKRMPPLIVNKNFRLKDDNSLLLASLQTADKKSFPFWARAEVGNGRIAQISADEIWRWGLASVGAGRDTAMFGDMVLASIQWVLGGGGHGFEAGPQRVLNLQGQGVKFNGRWENYSKQFGRNPRWSVTVNDGAGRKKDHQLTDLGNGDFTGELGSLPPGAYTFQTRLVTGGKQVYSSQGKFFVEPGHDERRDHLQNAGLLKTLAAVSGGEYWDERDVSKNNDWMKKIKSSGAPDTASQNPAGSILAICLLLSGEWFLRRKWGKA